MEYDFSGWATKNDLKCSDGRTIRHGAFADCDGKKVPLLWAHGHNDSDNVLGHCVLENRPEGTYAYATFNATPKGQNAKLMVQHGDIDRLSIFANRLKERDGNVYHGVIREVSLVLASANPGSEIDNVVIRHSDGMEELVDDALIIKTGLAITLEHADTDDSDDDNSEKTVEDIVETMNEEQKEALFYLVKEALQHTDEEEADESSEDSVEHSDDAVEDQSEQDHKEEDPQHDQEGNTLVHHNIFENDTNSKPSPSLSHDDIKSIFEDAKKRGSFKEAIEDYSLKHGIEEIDILFPDAKAVTNTPDFIKRRTEWVANVIANTRHTPFSRIKSMTADITMDEARAKGYIKGNLKREEFFKVAKRVTTPQTIYKKQKLDRDDILDITDFDVVTWLKEEMRVMLDEEIARAILIGDGRSNADDDKINETNIRPIATDDELYVTTVYVNVDDANSSADEIVDALTLHRRHYRGSGSPTFYTSETILAKLLLVKDGIDRRKYSTVADLAAALRVQAVVTCEVFENLDDLVGIMVNLSDYTVGSDKGGAVSMFDDFDIDYNQYKYLIETRISGALTKPKSALVVRKVAGNAELVTPVKPGFDGENVTVATTTGVVYKNKLTNATLTTGSPVTLAEGDTLTVIAIPASGYYFTTNADDEWTFEGE